MNARVLKATDTTTTTPVSRSLRRGQEHPPRRLVLVGRIPSSDLPVGSPIIRTPISRHEIECRGGGQPRPNLRRDSVDLNDAVTRHGSLRAYLTAQGIIKAGDNPKVIGVLFSGGPASSGNAVIRAIVKYARNHGMIVIGFERGYDGLISGKAILLNGDNTYKVFCEGDVMLGTERTNPDAAQRSKIRDDLQKWGIDKLVTIGGDDTQTTASKLSKDGVDIIGVPKTIDDDLPGTRTFGYQTFVEKAAEQLRSLHEDARSAGGWFMVSCMGRSSGSITVDVSMASETTLSIIREQYTRTGILQLYKARTEHPVLIRVLEEVREVVLINGRKARSIDELARLTEQTTDDKIIVDFEALVGQIARLIAKRKTSGHNYGMIAIAEGLVYKLGIEITKRKADGTPLKGKIPGINLAVTFDSHGNPVLNKVYLVAEIRKRLIKMGVGKITSTAAGYEFRCADPIATDMNMSTRLGTMAAYMLDNGMTGRMLCFANDRVSSVPFGDLPLDDSGHIVPRAVNLDDDRFFTLKEGEAYKQSV